MEQQFILRLPEQLQNLDLSEAKLIKHSALEVSLLHGDSSYPGVVCRLPTIVESQKDIDGKLFKVADISTMVVIFAKKDIDASAERVRIEADGLTPPMGHARDKRVQVSEDLGEIDKRLAELLREDAKAESVEFIEPGAEESSVDLDLLAAEIEENIGETEASSRDVPSPPAERVASTQEGGSDAPGSPPTTAASTAGASLAEGARRAAADGPPSAASALAIESPPSPSVSFEAQATQPADVPGWATANEPTDAMLDEHPDIIAIKNKIKEKQELRDKALNPILKKRFSQAVSELQAELHAKRNELSKS